MPPIVFIFIFYIIYMKNKWKIAEIRYESVRKPNRGSVITPDTLERILIN